jgi:hypothetical protein
VRALLDIFDVAVVDRSVLVHAFEGGFVDYEDAVLHEAAGMASVHAVVTRDRSGFQAATLPVFTPEAILAALRSAGEP